MGKLVPFKNAFPHKHYVATACPGTLDWEWICQEANRINEELAKPKPPVVVEPPVVKPEPPVVVVPEKPKPPVKPTEPKKVYYTVVRNDSYWGISAKLLKTTNPAKILKEMNRLRKLNNNKALFPGDKIRVK
jgi:nucleoid-associated protein YgaU